MITFMFQIDIEECSLYIFCAEIISYLGKSAEGYKEKKKKSCFDLRPGDTLKISLLNDCNLMNGTSKSRDNNN